MSMRLWSVSVLARLIMPWAMLVISADVLGAQRGPVQGSNTLSTTVGGVFLVSPPTPTLTQNSQSGNLCSPGACYVGSVTARGNRGWQLEVKLASTPSNFTVAHVQTTVPASAQAVNNGTQTWLNTTTWVPIARSTTSTAGSAVSVMFNARRNSGGNGQVPPAGDVAAVVQYRLVAYP